MKYSTIYLAKSNTLNHQFGKLNFLYNLIYKIRKEICIKNNKEFLIKVWQLLLEFGGFSGNLERLSIKRQLKIGLLTSFSVLL
jgi:hypothetical protein